MPIYSSFMLFALIIVVYIVIAEIFTILFRFLRDWTGRNQAFR